MCCMNLRFYSDFDLGLPTYCLLHIPAIYWSNLINKICDIKENRQRVRVGDHLKLNRFLQQANLKFFGEKKGNVETKNEQTRTYFCRSGYG